MKIVGLHPNLRETEKGQRLKRDTKAHGTSEEENRVSDLEWDYDFKPSYLTPTAP
jgi:hypothetical protein